MKKVMYDKIRSFRIADDGSEVSVSLVKHDDWKVGDKVTMYYYDKDGVNIYTDPVVIKELFHLSEVGNYEWDGIGFPYLIVLEPKDEAIQFQQRKENFNESSFTENLYIREDGNPDAGDVV